MKPDFPIQTIARKRLFAVYNKNISKSMRSFLQMTESTQKRQVRRGRIFPEHQSSPETRAKRIAQREELGKHCRQIFEQIRPQLMPTHYNWFIAIDPETGNYLLDEKFDGLMQKVKVHYPSNGKVRLTAFRLNEDGYCGLI